MRVASRLLGGSVQRCKETIRLLRRLKYVDPRQNRIEIAGAYSEKVLHSDIDVLVIGVSFRPGLLSKQ